MSAHDGQRHFHHRIYSISAGKHTTPPIETVRRVMTARPRVHHQTRRADFRARGHRTFLSEGPLSEHQLAKRLRTGAPVRVDRRHDPVPASVRGFEIPVERGQSHAHVLPKMKGQEHRSPNSRCDTPTRLPRTSSTPPPSTHEPEAPAWSRRTRIETRRAHDLAAVASSNSRTDCRDKSMRYDHAIGRREGVECALPVHPRAQRPLRCHEDSADGDTRPCRRKSPHSLCKA